MGKRVANCPVGRYQRHGCVDGVEKPLPVGDDDEVITMQLELTAGPIKVEAEFLDEQGFTRGAYFLEIAKTGTLREPVRLHE